MGAPHPERPPLSSGLLARLSQESNRVGPPKITSPNRLDLIEKHRFSRVDKAHSARARSVGYFHFIDIGLRHGMIKIHRQRKEDQCMMSRSAARPVVCSHHSTPTIQTTDRSITWTVGRPPQRSMIRSVKPKTSTGQMSHPPDKPVAATGSGTSHRIRPMVREA